MPGSARRSSRSAGTSPAWRSTIAVAHSCRRSARRGYPSRPHARIASAGGSAARAAGVGQRASQAYQIGSTLDTGVCCSMISLTSTPHGPAVACRHGRSRACPSNQAISASATVSTREQPAMSCWRSASGYGTLRCVNELAITVVGPDRPGIVADASGVLAGLRLNLTDSSMTLLRGHFAMTLICVGAPGAVEVEAALTALTIGGGLGATVRAGPPESWGAHAGTPYTLLVHGADRLGILATVTGVLARAGGDATRPPPPPAR